MANTGCCRFNLMQIDPSDGLIIWKRAIYGTLPQKIPFLPGLDRIEPLHGTNDVIVMAAGSITRVDPSGKQIWSQAGFLDSSADGVKRPFDVDATGISVGSIGRVLGQSTFRALNPDGSIRWTNQIFGVDIRTFRSFPTGNTMIISGFAGLLGGPPAAKYSLNTLTGAVTPLLGATNPAQGNVAAVSGSSTFIDDMNHVAAARELDVSTGSLVSTFPTSFTATNVRTVPGGTGGYVTAQDLTGVLLVPLIQRTDATGTPIFSLTAPGGLTLNLMHDACSDGSIHYFCGDKGAALGAGGPAIFALDDSGTLIWQQKYGGFSAPSVGGNGICLSEDGFLYVCGDVSIP